MEVISSELFKLVIECKSQIVDKYVLALFKKKHLKRFLTNLFSGRDLNCAVNLNSLLCSQNMFWPIICSPKNLHNNDSSFAKHI